jgi:hypothetical protein
MIDSQSSGSELRAGPFEIRVFLHVQHDFCANSVQTCTIGLAI